ncbi:sulfotransferase domain-containing protein [Tateyamaria sp.]|uniref:sulfotransferase domain-containing protein n=1 Tax=Tateyamaria sp. TaxID=1929288 RepID=UPI00329F4C13
MTIRTNIRSWAKLLQSRSNFAALLLKYLYACVALTEILRAHVYFGSARKRPQEYAPDFVCIGAQKTGTSWLDAVLRLHPQIAMPRNRKEVHFYDTGFWKGKKWYAWNFRGGRHRIRGDITPSYAILSPQAVQEMANFNPDTIVIFILRDPVERAWSMAYMDLIKTPKKRIEDVSDQIFLDHFKNSKSISRGRYSETIRLYLEAFGGDKLKILLYDDICTDPRNFLRTMLETVGVEISLMPDTKLLDGRVNVGGAAMPKRFKAELDEIYLDELEYLRSHIDRSKWPVWLENKKSV